MEQENGGWFWIENKIIERHAKDLGPIGVAVYCLLARRVNSNQECFPSRAHIAEVLGISDATAKKYLKLIVSLGLATKENRQDPAGDAANNLFRLKRRPRGVGQQLPNVGQEIPPGWAGDTQRVGQQLPPKKTNKNKTHVTSPPYPQPEPEPTTAALPTYSFSEEQLRTIETLNTRVGGGLTVNPTVLQFFRGWFQRGGTVPGLLEVVEHGLRKRQDIRSLAYFQSALNDWLTAGSPNSKGTSTPPPPSRFPTREEQRAETRRRMAAQEERIRLDNPGLWELMQRERAEARQKASA